MPPTSEPMHGSPRAMVDAMIRVDHAGEYGARRLYDCQLAVITNRLKFLATANVEFSAGKPRFATRTGTYTFIERPGNGRADHSIGKAVFTGSWGIGDLLEALDIDVSGIPDLIAVEDPTIYVAPAGGKDGGLVLSPGVTIECTGSIGDLELGSLTLYFAVDRALRRLLPWQPDDWSAPRTASEER